ncbi:type II toxin-antitoxin system YafQ family toxin [Mariniphaga sp.]|uniref:type II toxin-antitoxin system YafQ family toxin n=1 Tax=Mariniphaga sp. TaxID=1954475 RepID=UPI003561FD31
MSYTLSFTNQFKRDFKTCKKRNFPIFELQTIFGLLETGELLPAKYKSHKLSGNYAGCWECHIKPDWLLIWEKDTKQKEIKLIRTGTHTDLF